MRFPAFNVNTRVLVLFGVGLWIIFAAFACKGNTGNKVALAQPAATTLGADSGMNVTLGVSKPANGKFLVKGEEATVTVTLKDRSGGSLTRDDFATLGLYMYGPQETTRTVTSVKLLNASTDRTKTPHHYIDLLTDKGVEIKGNVLTYKLQAVTTEDPGTYTVAVRAVKKGATTVNQAFILSDIQLGTATIEKQIVQKENCAPCHQGTSNGQFYMHHVDPSGSNPYGSPSYDSVPVNTCKACHNNDGYAAYTSPEDGKTKIADPIVARVHGIHMGEELKNPINTDRKTGVFRDYTSVVFPADVKDCATCHTDDRWQTQPSRQACGACHDNTWFGAVASMPKTDVAHLGGPQSDDSSCTTCHSANAGSVAPISVAHNPAVDVEYDAAVLTMSQPANGKFYVAGEKPVVTVVIKDSSGNRIDHTKVDTLFSTANLYVYGPRSEAKPVLSTAAKIGNSNSTASATSSIAASGTPRAWTFAEGDTFKIAVNGGAVQVLTAPAGAQTPDQVVTWLKGSITGVNVTANNTAGSVTIASSVKGDNSRLEIYNSPVTTKMGWKPRGLPLIKGGLAYGQTSGVTVEPYLVIGNVSSVSNSLRGTSDPAVARTADKITYQLADVSGLAPGTYMAYVYTNSAIVKTDNGWPRAALGLATFQVGTATPEPKIAENCTQCHGNNVMHLNESHVHPGLFDTDYCLACHDYGRSGTGDLFSQVGGNSTSGWAGYGTKPIVARVHQVHFGAYLTHPEWVYSGDPNKFNEVIFPQDVRNCTVCHDKGTSGTWKTEPSRLACNSCHDTDKALAHMAVNTVDPTPKDPYGPDAVETCTICHGAGKDFSPDKEHSIANPYTPPYPR